MTKSAYYSIFSLGELKERVKQAYEILKDIMSRPLSGGWN